MTTNILLNPEIISKFNSDGVVLLKNFINDSWQKLIKEAIEEDIKNPSPHYHAYKTEGEKGFFHGSMRLWEHNNDFYNYCLKSPLPSFASQMLKTKKVNFFYDQLFVKEPETTNRIRWHNDQPYWPIRGWQVMSFWIALDPISKENGAMEFIKGSHLWKKWYQPEHFAPGISTPYELNPEFEKIPDIELNRDKYDIISFDMDCGDLLAFHALVVHGSGGNQSKKLRRRGYAVRYTGEEVVYSKHKGSHLDLRNPELDDGDVLDSLQYPVVWQNGEYIY